MSFQTNRANFFACARNKLFHGTMTQSQVDGINALLDEWERRKLEDPRWLAYMFGTDYWETAQQMQAIEEYGKGRGRLYGTPDAVTGKAYYGRGLVQLTWKKNYEKMGVLLGVDLVNNPEYACMLDVAVKIMFEGMLRADSHFGDFTGVALEDYFSPTKEDWVNARRIINGTDKAQEIADISKQFLACLKA